MHHGLAINKTKIHTRCYVSTSLWNMYKWPLGTGNCGNPQIVIFCKWLWWYQQLSSNNPVIIFIQPTKCRHFYNTFSIATQYCIVIGMEQICEMRSNFIFSHTCTALNINCRCLFRSLMPLYLTTTKTTIGYARNCGLVWKTLSLVFDSVCMNEIS